jgi:general secretion pathway protein G
MIGLGKRVSKGFTLIELMIVVAIMATLAAIAIPKFAEVLRKATEGSLKGNLGTLRSSLNIYYADNQGIYPTCAAGANSAIFTTALVPKYIAKIADVKSGLHAPTNAVYCDTQMVGGSVHDGQGWYYDGALPLDGLWGSLTVACDHPDSKGQEWSLY